MRTRTHIPAVFIMSTGMTFVLKYAVVLHIALEMGVLQIFSATEGVVSDKAGKMFLLSFLPTHDSSGNILLVISAHNDTNVQVENQFYNISLTYDIAQHDSVNVSLSPQLRYRNHLEIERKAVIVNSTADIAVHVFNIGNITSDGYVALPVEALSTRYLLAAFDKPSTIFSVFSNAKPSVSAFTIAALEDNTTITIKFKHSLSTCGVQPKKSTTVLGSFLNQFTFSFPQASVREDAKQKEVVMTIHKYDVIGTNCTVDPTGTIITSSRPVSVVSGGVCSLVPHAMMPECDHMEEMMIPSELFGSHFVFHELGGRPSGAIYRIIANENHTSITSTLGHGGTLHESQAADINIKETGPMCLSTSKPVLVVMFSKGSHADVPERFGGPFMTVVPSTERFSSMPVHLPHLWNMTFIQTRMTPYVTVIQKQECKDNFDMFDEVRLIPDCKYAVATMKLTRSYEQLVLMPEMKYGAIFYGFGSGEGFGFSTGISITNETSELQETRYCDSFPCLNDAVCIEGCPFSCLCRDGFQGRQCEQQKNNTMEPLFKDTDNCISNPCVRGQCRDRIDAYKCVCEPGFHGVNCEKDIDECLGDPCFYGDCKDGVNAYSCLCYHGYTGLHCDINIDDCSPDPCSGHGTCRDGVSNYSCICHSGYTGSHCHTDIDDCVNDFLCLNNGTCVDGVNMYSCMCSHGYTGRRCEHDIVECVSSPCRNGGYCVEGLSSYTCMCRAGYTGVNCEQDIDDCNPNPCLHDGTCADSVNNFICDCKEGFTGPQCGTDIDDCQGQPCLNNGTCVDGVDSFVCQCPRGYTGSLCQTDINECANNQCRHNSTCLDGVSSYVCDCAPGYVGMYCQTDIDECFSEPCLHNGVCIDGINSFNCSCKDGYFGILCNEEYTTTTPGQTSTSPSPSSTRVIPRTSSIPASSTSTSSSTTLVVNQELPSRMNVSRCLLLSYKNLSSYFRKRSTAHDSRISSILIGCGALLVTLCAMAAVCVHDCMVFFWTPRRKVEAFDMLRRHGLTDPSKRYAVTTTSASYTVTTTSIVHVREKSHGAIAAVEETVT